MLIEEFFLKISILYNQPLASSETFFFILVLVNLLYNLSVCSFVNSVTFPLLPSVTKIFVISSLGIDNIFCVDDDFTIIIDTTTITNTKGIITMHTFFFIISPLLTLYLQ